MRPFWWFDAVEGMGARTQQVFRETETYQLVPVLVINKIDRLKTELCLTPIEAYLRLRSLLETVNAAAAAIITSAQHNNNNSNNQDDKAQQLLEQQQKLWTFDPAIGNVIFASALFGWGFTVQALCRCLFRNKTVGIKPPLLRQYLFGDYKLKGTDKILKWKQQSGHDDDDDKNCTIVLQSSPCSQSGRFTMALPQPLEPSELTRRPRPQITAQGTPMQRFVPTLLAWTKYWRPYRRVQQ